MTRSRFVSAVVLLLAVLLSACGGGSKAARAAGSTTASALPACPLDALRGSSKPVDITVWHAMTRANDDELTALTNRFNASQSAIHVTLSAAATYADNLTRFEAGLSTGRLPDLFQGEDTSLQTLLDTHAVLPAQSCLEADHADTSDYVPRVLAYYSIKGVLWPMPFNNSNPLLYYNKAAFTRAGLDPDRPPTTLDAVQADARRIVQSGAAKYGIAIRTDPWLIQNWLAEAGHTFVNNGNGRQSRATSVTLDDATGVQLFTWLHDMVQSKIALNTGTAEIDHYLAVANDTAAMTIDTSAALGTIAQILESGQFKNVKLGVGRMPGPTSTNGGVLVGGAAMYIVNRSAPAKEAAAYRFAKFLDEPQSQADWASATGYTPVRKSATTLPALTTSWIRQPGYRVAYTQLLSGAENDATAGPVVGDYGAANEGVSGAIIDAWARMLTQNVPPAQAVHDAAANADTALQTYNSRVGP